MVFRMVLVGWVVGVAGILVGFCEDLLVLFREFLLHEYSVSLDLNASSRVIKSIVLLP